MVEADQTRDQGDGLMSTWRAPRGEAARIAYWRERGLSFRGANCLALSDIFTVEALQEKRWAEIHRIPNLGRRTLLEIITLFGLKDAPKGSGWSKVEWWRRGE
jgi:DNA-directed RNA polymerase alpha subunit